MLHVVAAQDNKVRSDRPGQVVFMAVNGVGINRRPSGDYALDVKVGDFAMTQVSVRRTFA